MMFFRRLKRQDIGKVISAATINRIADAVEHMSKMRATYPLSLQHTPTGPLLAITPYAFRLAVANGDITARSGTTPGFGSVYIVNVELTFSAGVITGGTLTTSNIAIQVYNPSADKMASGKGIDSGQYCWIQQDLSGFYSVSPAECS